MNESVEQISTLITKPIPEERATRLFTPGERGDEWFVLHTRPRCEKKAAEVCMDRQILHFLPLRKSTSRPKKGQRRYSFKVPLFPGYAFACCTPKERDELMRSNQLVSFIEVPNQQQLLDELWQIYVATATNTDLIFYPQLKRGRKVHVARGPLAGIKGRISTRKDGFRLVLNVSILGTAVAIEVDMADVEII